MKFLATLLTHLVVLIIMKNLIENLSFFAGYISQAHTKEQYSFFNIRNIKQNSLEKKELI